MRITIRLSREDGQKLDAIADQRGMSVSDVVRDMIRNSHEQQAVTGALKEIRLAINGLAAQRRENSGGEGIVEIRRVVTLIAKAMPSIAKHVQ